MLQPIAIPSKVDAIPIAPGDAADLAAMRNRIERFQDSWDQHHAAQFVAADYELVYRTLVWIQETQILIGTLFLEWGCGFATVACLAERLGFRPHGIEAHSELIREARKTVQSWGANVELFHGNFLPAGSDELAFDPTLPSLGHGGGDAYDHWGMDLGDFAIVYSYPWPGEDEFHEDVFERDASDGAILLMFIGPNEMRAWRKVSKR